jgi:hypothetical protein
MGERRWPILIGGAVIAFIAIILVWAFAPSSRTASANLTEITDRPALQSGIELSHISIATGENYFGNKIRVISGEVKNTSDKALRRIDVKMTFIDYDGKPIQETVERAYENARKPLEPGVQHHFEVNFENLPKGWNYRIPNVEVVKIGY